jgi:hypothetical protein
LYPFDHIAIDLGQPTLETTSGGNNFVLVVVDICTRFVVLRSLPDKRATTVAWELLQIFADFGVPLIVQSDNGREFQSKLSEKMAELLGIDQRFILPNNPRANGVCEAQVKITKAWLFKMMDAVRKDNPKIEWDQLIPAGQMALNTKIAKATSSAPHELMYARARNPFQGMTEADGVMLTASQLKKRAQAMINIVFPEVLARTKRYQAGYQKSFDASHTNADVYDFCPGTIVMKRDMRLKKKSLPRFTGPYRISKVKNGRAHISHKESGIGLTRAVPFDQLKWVEAAPEVQKPESEDGAGSQVYTVDKVLDHRVNARNKITYRTKWMNYPQGDSTWEPLSNFIDTSTVKTYWEEKGLTIDEGQKQAVQKEKEKKKKKKKKRRR